MQVRSKEEILATLDANGRLDELPFMPEMLTYCGARMMVGKRAHKTCDPALGIGGRKMANTVHLSNIRCNGAAHDGCEAGMPDLLEGSLAEADRARQPANAQRAVAAALASRAGCTEDVLHSSIRIPPAPGETEPTYVCQNTQIKFATQPLPWWDVRQYVEDYTSGNVPLSRACRSACCIRSGGPLPKPASVSARRCAGSTISSSARSAARPIRSGRTACPRARRCRARTLDLQAGEMVRVKPYKDILKTLDSTYRNRGLYFDAEMVPFTEREYEVERRQKQIIDEAPARWSASRPTRSSSRMPSAKRATRFAAASARARSIPIGARSGWSACPRVSGHKHDDREAR